MVQDIERLVKIESIEDLEAAAPARRSARAESRFDRSSRHRRGHGFFDVRRGRVYGLRRPRGSGGKQIGIIGHMDVVPAGPGWHHEPYAVTEREGFLVGRGVLDDKGPSLAWRFTR